MADLPEAFVGAGLAGLSAAHYLREMGRGVVAIEAQDRPGGRVRTIRDPLVEGQYAEAGAARIPNTHEQTLHWIRRFGLTLVPWEPEDPALVILIDKTRVGDHFLESSAG